MTNFEENWCFVLRNRFIYPSYLYRPWKPCGASRSNGPRSKGQKSSHPMPWTAFGKSWTIKTFIMNQTSLSSRQNLWISRMIWHHRKGNIQFCFVSLINYISFKYKQFWCMILYLGWYSKTLYFWGLNPLLYLFSYCKIGHTI